MKSTKAMKNIRLFKNAQNGKPKRVTTGVDDYGNRFHVVNGKVKHSRSLSENKKAARKLANPVVGKTKEKIRHFKSNHRRSKLFSKHSTSNPLAGHKYNDLKVNYHAARFSANSKRKATDIAKQIHGTKRKAKNFTK